MFSAWTLCRLAFAEVTRGVLADPSAWRAPLTSEKRRLSWAALRFAALADLTLLVNGPALKRKGHANGRLADALSSIFFGISAVRRAIHEGRTGEDPLVRASVETCLARADEAFIAVLREFQAPLLGPLLRGPRPVVGPHQSRSPAARATPISTPWSRRMPGPGRPATP